MATETADRRMRFDLHIMEGSCSKILRKFTAAAVFTRDGVPPPAEIADRPELTLYWKNFGQTPGDLAVLGFTRNGKVAGACWARITEDYGHIDSETPSLAISVLPEYRGHRLGTAMLMCLLFSLHRKGYAAVSLSVQKENPAVHLYKRAGFQVVEEKETEWIMRMDLTRLPDAIG